MRRFILVPLLGLTLSTGSPQVAQADDQWLCQAVCLAAWAGLIAAGVDPEDAHHFLNGCTVGCGFPEAQ